MHEEDISEGSAEVYSQGGGYKSFVANAQRTLKSQSRNADAANWN